MQWCLFLLPEGVENEASAAIQSLEHFRVQTRVDALEVLVRFHRGLVGCDSGRGRARFGSDRLWLVRGTVPAVPVFGSDDSCCNSFQFEKKCGSRCVSRS